LAWREVNVLERILFAKVFNFGGICSKSAIDIASRAAFTGITFVSAKLQKFKWPDEMEEREMTAGRAARIIFAGVLA
jgi:hypothetical protein